MFRSGGLIPPSSDSQPEEVFPAVHPGQCLHPLQLLLPLGPLQPPGPPGEQGETALHPGLLHHPHRHALLRHGPAERHTHPHSCSAAGDRLALVRHQLHTGRSDGPEVVHKTVHRILQVCSEQEPASVINLAFLLNVFNFIVE